MENRRTDQNIQRPWDKLSHNFSLPITGMSQRSKEMLEAE